MTKERERKAVRGGWGGRSHFPRGKEGLNSGAPGGGKMGAMALFGHNAAEFSKVEKGSSRRVGEKKVSPQKKK